MNTVQSVAAQKNHSYKKDSVGRVMSTQVPVVSPELTIGDVFEFLHSNVHQYETINYVYVIDESKKLVGVLSVREIFSIDKSKKVKDVCVHDHVYMLHPDAHQERAAYLALTHNIKAIPVVDHDHKFLGEVTADSVLKILHKEMHEDTLKKAGIRHSASMRSNVLTLSLTQSFFHRIPWLLLGLFGGLLAAKIIGLYDALLENNLVLASFIPLIVYMSSAVGTQMETYIIRDLAMEQDIPFLQYFLRHSLVVITMGIVLSLLLFGLYGAVSLDWFMAFVLSVSLLGAVFSSVFTGLLVPYSFSKLSLDPADASGPIATILQDILSILIYFSIATAFL